MNKQLSGMIATLLILPFGVIVAQTAGDEIAEPPSVSASAEPVPAAGTGTGKTSAADKVPDPINGAFGIPLGEYFKPSMVAKVLDEQEQSYRGQDGAEMKGALLHVEPSEPDARFQRYSVKTSNDGIIYAIRGDYQFEVEQGKGKQVKVKRARVVRATCKAAVKALAEELEASYGKPRGKGWDGEWFSFRQLSDTENKSLRLYAHQCRTGMYSVLYTDENVQRGMLPGKAGTSSEADTPAMNPEAIEPSSK
jgi:hypothetical protein